MSAQQDYPFLSGDEAELLELMDDDERGRMWAWHVIAEGQKPEPSTRGAPQGASGEAVVARQGA